MKYALHYNNQLIGRIEQDDADFPNLFGRYTILPTIEQNHPLIVEYIRYSVKMSILMKQGEHEGQHFIEKEEAKFTKLIKSESWTLIDSSGQIHNILIPVFCDKNEIVWRWNF